MILVSIWQASINLRGFYLLPTVERDILCSVINNEILILLSFFIYHYNSDFALHIWRKVCQTSFKASKKFSLVGIRTVDLSNAAQKPGWFFLIFRIFERWMVVKPPPCGKSIEETPEALLRLLFLHVLSKIVYCIIVFPFGKRNLPFLLATANFNFILEWGFDDVFVFLHSSSTH